MDNSEKYFHDYLKKLYTFCAYRDRSEWEVREKMRKLGVEDELIPRLLDNLRSEKFLDESRFAESYVRGKFYQNKWGRHKIARGLSEHQLPDRIAEQALKQIPERDYLSQLKQLAIQKRDSLKGEEDPLNIRNKTYRFLMSKGYESHLISSVLRKTGI